MQAGYTERVIREVCMAKLVGIFPGSFDPFHAGHEAVVAAASALVDTLYVTVADNQDKAGRHMFHLVDRMKLCEIGVRRYPNVKVTHTDKLVAKFARQSLNADVIFRGLRYVTEYEKELDQAFHNAKLGNGIRTVGIFPTDLYISSTAIRLLILQNDPTWKDYVDPEVAKHIDGMTITKVA